MSNDFVTRIDMVRVNDDGTIEIIDTLSWTEHPFTFQYKLYLTFEENLANIFKLLFEVPPVIYEFSPRFKVYIDNRIALYEEASKIYLPMIDEINQSQKTDYEKKCLIDKVDFIMNELHKYDG